MDALLESDSLNRSHAVGDLLREAYFRLHCTKAKNEDLSTRVTAARARVDEKELKVQHLTLRTGALEAHLEARKSMHTGGVAPATEVPGILGVLSRA